MKVVNNHQISAGFQNAEILIQRLPSELLIEIFSHMGWSFGNCLLVSKSWYQLASDKLFLKRIVLNNPILLNRAARSQSPLLQEVLDDDSRNFGAQLTVISQFDWKKLGKIGEVPSLPLGIMEILKSPCPFVSGKSILETHALLYIPASVGDNRLTMEHLNNTVQKPKNVLITLFEEIFDKCKNMYIEESGWMLITKEIIPGSQGKSYYELENLIGKTPNYEIPNLMSATAYMLMINLINQENRYDNSFTQCREIFKGNLRFTLSALKDGYLRIDVTLTDKIGVLALRKLG